MKVLKITDLKIGQSAEEIGVITSKDVRRFARISGDMNPIHLDREAAAVAGFERCIVHGALIVAYISALIAEKLPGPGSIAVSLDQLKFRRPVYVDHAVVVRVEVIDIDLRHNQVKLSCFCGMEGYGGKPAVKGEATVRIPPSKKARGPIGDEPSGEYDPSASSHSKPTPALFG